MKKLIWILLVTLLLSGCGAAKEKAACTFQSGNNTVTITEGRDLSADKDGQIISVKQTFQVDSTEEDVIVIYKEYYEKELSKFASDEKVKTSLTETETGLLITLEYDVKNMTESSKDHMMELLDTKTLEYETVLSSMKDTGFKCGDEEPETTENPEENNENKETE